MCWPGRDAAIGPGLRRLGSEARRGWAGLDPGEACVLLWCVVLSG